MHKSSKWTCIFNQRMFTTMQERDDYFASIGHDGNSVPYGAAQSHAATANGNFTEDLVVADTARLMAKELEQLCQERGLDDVQVDPEIVQGLVAFNQFYDASRQKEILPLSLWPTKRRYEHAKPSVHDVILDELQAYAGTVSANGVAPRRKSWQYRC